MKRVLAAMSLAFAAAPAAGQGADILLNCTSCHALGARPDARAPSPYPILNGQPVRYLALQLHAYRKGLREHPQMQATATALGDGAGAMARMYADAPVPPLTAPADTAPFGNAPKLVSEGDWSRGLAPCASCHALEAEERGRAMPRLHGQPATYLSRQLRAYAEGRRQSDAMGRMRAFADRLTLSEIDALAEYYSSWAETEREQTDPQSQERSDD